MLNAILPLTEGKNLQSRKLTGMPKKTLPKEAEPYKFKFDFYPQNESDGFYGKYIPVPLKES